MPGFIFCEGNELHILCKLFPLLALEGMELWKDNFHKVIFGLINETLCDIHPNDSSLANKVRSIKIETKGVIDEERPLKFPFRILSSHRKSISASLSDL